VETCFGGGEIHPISSVAILLGKSGRFLDGQPIWEWCRADVTIL
jgi:hypothetical protein